MLVHHLASDPHCGPAASVTPLPDLPALGQGLRRLTGLNEYASTDYFPSSSQAHLHALRLARLNCAGRLAGNDHHLVAYCSDMAHGSVALAFEQAGYDAAALRQIATDGAGRMRCDLLQAAVRADRDAGLQPFFLCGAAGNSENGTVDALGRLAAIARDEDMWLHLDASYGALARLAPDLAPLLGGMEQAGSLSFDLYRWGLQPYPTAILFSRPPSSGVVSARRPATPDLAAQLATSLRALAQWQQLALPASELGRQLSRCCALARRFGLAVQQQAALELLLPVTLNVVCLRYAASASDALHQTIVASLQGTSPCAISSCRIGQQLAIRVAVQNASLTPEQLDQLLAALLAAASRPRRAGTQATLTA